MKKAKALVLYGDGINCEDETAHALELAGLESKKMHCADMLSAPQELDSVQMLVFPGGFSFGDEIASGKVLAVKLRGKLQDALHRFVDRDKLIVGICNGFQILAQLEILPDSRQGAERTVSLCHNSGGQFINRWVRMNVTGTSRFFKGLTNVHLPIRHGEGKLTLSSESSEELEEKVKRQAPLRYYRDINGSYDQIAALTNEGDNVLGIMPHPEAFVRWNQHPSWTQLRYGTTQGELALAHEELNNTPHGLQILKNAAEILN